MAIASNNAQRFCWQLSLDTELLVSEIQKARFEFAKVCMEAYDKDPNYDFAEAEEEVYHEIENALKRYREEDKDAINAFLAIRYK